MKHGELFLYNNLIITRIMHWMYKSSYKNAERLTRVMDHIILISDDEAAVKFFLHMS